MDLTETEKKIIEIIREFKPFERIEIIKDQGGKPDTYFVHRSQKLIISKQTIIARTI